MVIAENELSEELFSDVERAKLAELLERSARTKLHPAIANFLRQVEGALQNSVTAEKTGKPKPAATTAEQPVPVRGKITMYGPGTNKGETNPPATPAAPAMKDIKPTAKLPEGAGLSRILGSAIKNLPLEMQEAVRKRALSMLGERQSGELPYDHDHLRAFEDFAFKVAELSGDRQAKLKIDDLLRNSGVVSDPAPTRIQRPVETVSPARRDYGAKTATGRLEPGKTSAAGQPEPQPSVDFYISRLGAASQGLGKKEQAAVRAYAWNLLGAEGEEQAKNAKASLSQSRALAVFTESFSRIQKFEGLPSELYDVLGGFYAGEERRMKELQDDLRAARDSFDVLRAVSKHANSPYAPHVEDMADIYREDPDMVSLLKERAGFHAVTVNARNSMPRLRAGQFYETVKKISHDPNWGNRYSDILKLAWSAPKEAVRFFAWASAQQKIEGHQFDSELKKYMPLGSRARPATRDDF